MADASPAATNGTLQSPAVVAVPVSIHGADSADAKAAASGAEPAVAAFPTLPQLTEAEIKFTVCDERADTNDPSRFLGPDGMKVHSFKWDIAKATATAASSSPYAAFLSSLRAEIDRTLTKTERASYGIRLYFFIRKRKSATEEFLVRTRIVNDPSLAQFLTANAEGTATPLVVQVVPGASQLSLDQDQEAQQAAAQAAALISPLLFGNVTPQILSEMLPAEVALAEQHLLAAAAAASASAFPASFLAGAAAGEGATGEQTGKKTRKRKRAAGAGGAEGAAGEETAEEQAAQRRPKRVKRSSASISEVIKDDDKIDLSVPPSIEEPPGASWKQNSRDYARNVIVENARRELTRQEALKILGMLPASYLEAAMGGGVPPLPQVAESVLAPVWAEAWERVKPFFCTNGVCVIHLGEVEKKGSAASTSRQFSVAKCAVCDSCFERWQILFQHVQRKSHIASMAN